VGVHPISPGAIVSRVWEIYRDQFGVLFGTAVVLYAVQFVIYLLLPAATGIFLVILFWALGVLYEGMVVELVKDLQDGRRDYSVAQLLRSVEPVFWPLVAVSVLFGIGVAIGFVLLIVPGLILLVVWSLVAPVTVLERPGVWKAFGRSRQIVRGNGWNVFGVMVILFVIVFLVSIAVGLIASGLGSFGHAVVQWVVNAAITPVTALSASVLYFALTQRDARPQPTYTPPSVTPTRALMMPSRGRNGCSTGQMGVAASAVALALEAAEAPW
jgi:hypothetical protein